MWNMFIPDKNFCLFIIVFDFFFKQTTNQHRVTCLTPLEKNEKKAKKSEKNEMPSAFES